jgi:hypothetical protein
MHATKAMIEDTVASLAMRSMKSPVSCLLTLSLSRSAPKHEAKVLPPVEFS